jgi:hypothetical protein
MMYGGSSHSLQLVELHQHDRLLLAEVPPEHLAHIRHERDHNRKRLAS